MNQAALFDTSAPLRSANSRQSLDQTADCDSKAGACGLSPDSAPGEEDGEAEAQQQKQTEPLSSPAVPALSAAIEQTSQGRRPPAALIDAFDGLGAGLAGSPGAHGTRNPSDNSLAVGPDHVVQIVNSRLAVYSKKGAKFLTTGQVLYGPVVTNTIFAGFGGQCEHRVSGDAVVRYDQLANRWLYVLPIFQRPLDDPKGPYSMCYAVSTGPDPLGAYYRYEFKRPLFPDYPRPAIWSDGYYIPTSTGDTVIQKHACVADRTKMLAGLPATEQCVIIDGVNFLNNADIDGQTLPPANAPNIIMAAGGSQLLKRFEDDGIYVYTFHVDWDVPSNTKLSSPLKINVSPYHYLCDGQLTNCVFQPGTETRLDAQGDKLMQRLVYRNFGDHESIVGLHSVDTSAHGGGVRWYEFRLDQQRQPYLYQQGTYAPDRFYRWMGSIGIDRQGNIAMGYSFGGTPNFPGQRFAARLAGDARNQLTLHETTLVEGQASQINTLRWEDYTTTAMDPSDDCTFWYVGDYLKSGSPGYSTKIGAFRLPGCLQGEVSGTVYFDLNHNGQLDPGEPGLPGRKIRYTGSQSDVITTNANGRFNKSLNADPAYSNTRYSLAELTLPSSVWTQTTDSAAGHHTYAVQLNDRAHIAGLNFGNVCVARNGGAQDVHFWSGRPGKFWSRHNSRSALSSLTGWPDIVNTKLYLVNQDGSRFQVSEEKADAALQLRAWLNGKSDVNMSHQTSVQLAVTALNIAFNMQDAHATTLDPITGDWPAIDILLNRVSKLIEAHPNTSVPSPDREDARKYKTLLEELNSNRAVITPSNPDKCVTAAKSSKP